MQVNVKTKNSKNLKVKVLVDSEYIHMGIDEQIVKEKRIQMKLINFSFEVFNTDRTKNREVTRILWNALNTNIFLFLLSIFLDFIFLFLFSDDEETCDIAVT